MTSGERETIVIQIKQEYRKYKFLMESRKAADLRLGAHIRTVMGWRKDLPAAEAKAIRDAAAAAIKKPAGTDFEDIILAHVDSLSHFDKIETDTVKKMERLAKSLPVWKEFGEGVRGFGAKSMAVIVAQAGDLSNYDDKAKLWKRMGLAVMGDVRQGGLSKGAGAEAWIAHGYSPVRRSEVWNIGDTMLKAQVRKVKDDAGEDSGARMSLGEYGAAYLARKEYEIARAPDIKPIVAHRRAQRYMEKRLLKHLWQAWRRDQRRSVERLNAQCPDAQFLQAAE